MTSSPRNFGSWRPLPEERRPISGAVAANVSARGLRIRGAKVCGELNLEAADIPFPLAFRDCYFERPITLQLVRMPSLRFPGSYAPSVNGDQIAVLGNVELTQGFASEGEVRFRADRCRRIGP
jgi:hypothetical protein